MSLFNTGSSDGGGGLFSSIFNRQDKPIVNQSNKTLVEQSIDKHFPDDPSIKAAIMSQIQKENDTFDPDRIEDTSSPNKGIGLFQFTDLYDKKKKKIVPGQRDSLNRWLYDNNKENTIDNQMEYFKKITTTNDKDWAAKYHNIGEGNRNHIRNSFANGSAAKISHELSSRFEKFKGYQGNTSRKKLADKLELKYYSQQSDKDQKSLPPYNKMYAPPKTLQEVTAMAQVQPALQPFNRIVEHSPPIRQQQMQQQQQPSRIVEHRPQQQQNQISALEQLMQYEKMFGN